MGRPGFEARPRRGLAIGIKTQPQAQQYPGTFGNFQSDKTAAGGPAQTTNGGAAIQIKDFNDLIGVLAHGR
jgi:hypothetical protein